MTDKRPPPSLEGLDEKIRQAQERRDGTQRQKRRDERSAGLSLAMRIGVELVAALIVGVGIGYLLDRWLGTAPWLLLVFFLLGSAAGIMNVFRVTKGLGGAVGYQSEPPRDEPPKDEPPGG